MSPENYPDGKRSITVGFLCARALDHRAAIAAGLIAFTVRAGALSGFLNRRVIRNCQSPSFLILR